MAVAQRKSFLGYLRDLSLLKKLFWLYFILLVFEGALRKWVVPQLSAPLLIVRDPVGLMIIWEAFRTHKWPHRWSVIIQVLAVSIVGLAVAQVLFVNNPWLAAAFGLRSYLLPFPVAFIMGENLDREDLRRFGACTLFLLLPLTALALLQYSSPPTSWVNAGAYEGARQIAYVDQGVRASGTFSFVIGMSLYGTLAAAFLFYGMAEEGFAANWLLWMSAAALILMVPTTGERALVVQLGAVVACVAVSAVLGLSRFAKVLRLVVPLAILAFLISFLPIFSHSIEAMGERFAGGNGSEGGSFQASLFERTIEPIVNEVGEAQSTDSWMGQGIGRGAVAVQEVLVGNNQAVAGEDEYSREVIEMGPIMGILFGIFKICLTISILATAVARARDQEPLALLLGPMALVGILMTVPEQPTEQGFMVVGMAFCIAAARAPVRVAQVLPVSWRPRPAVRPRVQRG